MQDRLSITVKAFNLTNITIIFNSPRNTSMHEYEHHAEKKINWIRGKCFTRFWLYSGHCRYIYFYLFKLYLYNPLTPGTFYDFGRVIFFIQKSHRIFARMFGLYDTMESSAVLTHWRLELKHKSKHCDAMESFPISRRYKVNQSLVTDLTCHRTTDAASKSDSNTWGVVPGSS